VLGEVLDVERMRRAVAAVLVDELLDAEYAAAEEPHECCGFLLAAPRSWFRTLFAAA
jgi:hypothetical protein